MTNSSDTVEDARKQLLDEFEGLEEKEGILRSKTLKSLYHKIPDLPQNDRASFGELVNKLKEELQLKVEENADNETESRGAIDITAPFDVNINLENRPQLAPASQGSKHPLSKELETIGDIFLRMGFDVEDSRQLDDDYHMFGSLNFPKDHPARDVYDSFQTEEGLIPPAHTSTMQNRVMKKYDIPIRVVIPGRVYRNEDLDARHEHTFHQVEGVYVDENIALTDMLGTIKAFLETYFDQNLEFKTQPFYFPFVEPGLEYLISCPFCKKKGCSICSKTGWMEIMGCGMIHPNVLREGGIDPVKYSGFAWGFGVERLVMIKYGIEDVRHFHSSKLAFLRKFK